MLIDLLDRFPILFVISSLISSMLQHCLSGQTLLSLALHAIPEQDPQQARKLTWAALRVGCTCCARDDTLQSTTVAFQTAASVSKTSR